MLFCFIAYRKKKLAFEKKLEFSAKFKTKLNAIKCYLS